MEKGSFVNEAFTFAIKEYLDSKKDQEGIKYNSFFTVVIRLLTLIYDELDIINPFYFNNEESLNTNLKKYDYSDENIKKFKDALQNYYGKETEEGFTFIQKCLVDMFIKKYISLKLSDEEISNFRSLLYSPYSSNPLIVSYNFFMTKKPNEILNYFDKCLADNAKKEIVKPKETLNLGAYEILKYSLEDIKAMSSDELDEVNKKVYSYFDINDNAINKKYLLDKAVFDFNHPKQALSTGNGYVDILFFLSIIATVGMIILVITLLFL